MDHISTCWVDDDSDDNDDDHHSNHYNPDGDHDPVDQDPVDQDPVHCVLAGRRLFTINHKAGLIKSLSTADYVAQGIPHISLKRQSCPILADKLIQTIAANIKESMPTISAYLGTFV